MHKSLCVNHLRSENVQLHVWHIWEYFKQLKGFSLSYNWELRINLSIYIATYFCCFFRASVDYECLNYQDHCFKFCQEFTNSLVPNYCFSMHLLRVATFVVQRSPFPNELPTCWGNHACMGTRPQRIHIGVNAIFTPKD